MIGIQLYVLAGFDFDEYSLAVRKFRIKVRSRPVVSRRINSRLACAARETVSKLERVRHSELPSHLTHDECGFGNADSD